MSLESSMASTPQTDNEISVRKVDVANSVSNRSNFADQLFLLEQKLHGLENKTGRVAQFIH